MKKDIAHIKLPCGPIEINGKGKTSRIVVCLTTGLKVSSKSIMGICVKPLATKRALNLSMVPFSVYLKRYAHLGPIILASIGIGTRDQVLF